MIHLPLNLHEVVPLEWSLVRRHPKMRPNRLDTLSKFPTHTFLSRTDMLTDIEIAQQTKLIPIDQLAHEYGLSDDQFIPYGRDKAKVALDTSNAKGKLILVTATSGMPAGSGKTTTSIAVAQAFKKLGEKACLALREPSLGPSFGMKGGAAGGGYSQVVPMESINLHFTGDFHAITAANNLLAALIDNARHQGQVDLKEITWRRVLDVNDRMLRNIVTGLGGPANGIPTETGFDITAASELMAIICLADGEEDLRTRLDRLVVGLKRDGSAYTCKELGATGALMALLKDAMLPNLVQSIEGVPAFVHGGPRQSPAFRRFCCFCKNKDFIPNIRNRVAKF